MHPDYLGETAHGSIVCTRSRTETRGGGSVFGEPHGTPRVMSFRPKVFPEGHAWQGLPPQKAAPHRYRHLFGGQQPHERTLSRGDTRRAGDPQQSTDHTKELGLFSFRS